MDLTPNKTIDSGRLILLQIYEQLPLHLETEYHCNSFEFDFFNKTFRVAF